MLRLLLKMVGVYDGIVRKNAIHLT